MSQCPPGECRDCDQKRKVAAVEAELRGERELGIPAAVAKEREAIAVLVEQWGVDRAAFVAAGPRAVVGELERIAAAIRARK